MRYKTAITLKEPPVVDEIELSPAELATAMDPEVGAFDLWFRSKGNQPLTRMERSILKTYLAWKILYEEHDEETNVDPSTGGRTNG